jgi:hypothetical protein
MNKPGYKNDIRFGFYYFLSRTDYLRRYLALAADLSTNKKDELFTIIKNSTYAHFIVNHGEDKLKDFYNLDLWFQPTLLHSTFVMAYSLFEFEIGRICKELEKEDPGKGQLGNDKRDLIKRYRKFLCDNWKIKSAGGSSKNWMLITKYQTFRNALVHDSGVLEPDEIKNLQEMIDAYKISAEVNSPIVITNLNFIIDFFQLIRDYVHEIVKEIAPVEKN